MDKEKVISWLEGLAEDDWRECYSDSEVQETARQALNLIDALLKEQEGFLGFQQTVDSITFISTGTAQQGEERGIVLGQARMHDWLEKELLHRGLLTDAIRAVFHDARRLVK